MSGLAWERDGRDWPNREASRFVDAGGVRWHVQQMGCGPTVLLVHGTGASTHSWRTLAPILAEHFAVVSMDLPGHGFTRAPGDRALSLPGMAQGLTALLAALDVSPSLAVGHSAGAAILLRMALDGHLPARGIVSLNGAILPFRGVASHIFSPLAKLLVLNPFVPRFFAWGASGPVSVERLIRNTGSAIDAEGVALYARLLRDPAHVSGALRMMANWDLEALARDLPRLTTPLMLVAAGEDRTIAPDDAFRVKERLPHATVEYVRGLGHLAHEERPAVIAGIIEKAAEMFGVTSKEAQPVEGGVP